MVETNTQLSVVHMAGGMRACPWPTSPGREADRACQQTSRGASQNPRPPFPTARRTDTHQDMPCSRTPHVQQFLHRDEDVRRLRQIWPEFMTASCVRALLDPALRRQEVGMN